MTKVKICGITRLEDAELAIGHGAWALGFILWPQSKRYVDPGVAAGIARAVRRQVETVGVFVNQPLDEIAGLVDALGVTHVQLHGDEGPSFCSAVAQRTGAKVIKAVRIGARLRPAGPRALPHRPAPARHGGRRPVRRHRPHVGLEPARAAPREGAVPALRRADGRERRRGDRRRAAVGRRRRVGRRGVAGDQGSRRSWQAFFAAVEGVACQPLSTASAPTAASTCRRRSCPRSRSSRRPGSTARDDPDFQREFQALLKDYVGRPSPLYHAARLSEAVGHAVYLKREDLNHTGAHKINNAIGQCLLAKRLGKHRIIAETGAGQHGVATATACALLGLECIVYMGTEDMRRQKPNVLRMELLGAKMAPVDAGTATLKEAISAAIRDWTTTVETTHYVLGTCAGPAPFPALVRDLQRVIGDEARAQMLEQAGRLPDRVIACVGGGSNAIGIFTAFVPGRRAVALVGVEPAGEGIETGRHGAPLTIGGRGGVLHGAFSAIMQDEEGQILEAHSISAGLDYPGVGPEHAWLRDSGRATLRRGHRRRRAGRVPAHGRARGDHPGARVLARARVGAAPTLRPRTRSTSSASPAAATRTWPRRSTSSGMTDEATASPRRSRPRPAAPR